MNKLTAFCAGLAGGVLFVRLARSEPRPHDRAPLRGPRPVRNAGPAEMRDPPQGWSRADDLSDQSFPASDPPGTY